MFSSGPNYSKLKTNLRLAVNRLKLLEKKKTELALKARKEIADYISAGKTERAKIRVEHIIREDYLVEAMEVTEMYCDLLLARFGLIQQMKDLDEGLAEAISSLIWVAPRLQTDVAELRLIADNLALKYGKPYAQACREQAVATISEKLIHKLSVQAPPKILVEKYLIEIAKNYNIEYEPDPQVIQEADWSAEDPLINLNDKNDLGGSGGAAGGGGGGGMNIASPGFTYPLPPVSHPSPFDYPQELSFSKTEEGVLNLASFVPSILLTNPQSLTNCFSAFVDRVKANNPDVVAVSETWFSPNHPASDFQMDGYTLFHDDREERRGGGVALYVRTRLLPYSPAVEVPPVLECIWAGVGPALYLCSLYHAPRAPTGKLLLEHLVNTVLDLRSNSREPVKVVVIGDFNDLPHERLFSTLKLRNLVMEPTHKNSAIDLILTDVPNLFGEPQLLPPIGNSGHNCVLVKPAQPGVGGYGMGTGTGSDQWDALMGLENSPPPPYSSMVRPPASAPPPSFPPTSFGGMGQDRSQFPPDVSSHGGFQPKEDNIPKPSPRSKFEPPSDPGEFHLPDLPNVPDLPSVPNAPSNENNEDGADDIDFDDLNKRFEQLKKKK